MSLNSDGRWSDKFRSDRSRRSSTVNKDFSMALPLICPSLLVVLWSTDFLSTGEMSILLSAFVNSCRL